MPHYQAVVRDPAGNTLSSATVTVFAADTQNLASLFSDLALTIPIDNPTEADEDGLIDFYIASGRYDILMQRVGIEDRLLEDVEIGLGVPSGPASGDLAGTYPDPTVAGIRGLPVEAGAPIDGEVLAWDATAGEIQWTGGTELLLDPRAIVLPAQLFFGVDALNGGSVLGGAFATGTEYGVAGRYLATESAARIVSIVLPESYYGNLMNFRILASSEVDVPSGDTRFEWDVDDAIPLALHPANAINLTLPARGAPALFTLGQVSVPGTAFDGMVNVVLTRDHDHVDDTSGDHARVFYVILEPV